MKPRPSTVEALKRGVENAKKPRKYWKKKRKGGRK